MPKKLAQQQKLLIVKLLKKKKSLINQFYPKQTIRPFKKFQTK